MDHKELLKRVDHTLLTPTATWDQVQKLCDEGLAFGTASVCIPPRYVSRAAGYVGQRLKLCTVVGFPNGYATPEVKVFETEDAIRNGADEIDMVMDLGLAKAGDWEGVLAEIRAVKASCGGHILKVIVEACQLTQEEKAAACRIVSMSGADFIKTSTGFSSGGATVEDVKFFRERISPDVRVKAAGGIRHLPAGPGHAGRGGRPHRRQCPGRAVPAGGLSRPKTILPEHDKQAVKSNQKNGVRDPDAIFYFMVLLHPSELAPPVRSPAVCPHPGGAGRTAPRPPVR